MGRGKFFISFDRVRADTRKLDQAKRLEVTRCVLRTYDLKMAKDTSTFTLTRVAVPDHAAALSISHFYAHSHNLSAAHFRFSVEYKQLETKSEYFIFKQSIQNRLP